MKKNLLQPKEFVEMPNNGNKRRDGIGNVAIKNYDFLRLPLFFRKEM